MTTSTHISKDFFHPDHLGSTSYITNLLGEVSQHMEYFVFGATERKSHAVFLESWERSSFVEEHRSSNNSPYKLNGKELDEETGWYYYGARYYDPRISIWLSVDPLANVDYLMNNEAFINGEHNGGIYNSFNHNSYSYTYQNPVLYIDPNGKQAVTGAIIGAGVGAFTEYASIIAEKMFVDNKSFIEANQDLDWKDGIDIGVGAAFGAASGVIDNGISRFAKWITKPRNQKIMVFLLEYGVSVAENVVKSGIGYATGEESDFSLSAILIGALAETGMGHLISDKFVKNAIKDADNSIARITRKLNNLSERKNPNQKLINKERQKLEEAKSMKNMLKTIETGQEATSKTTNRISTEKTKDVE